jgi:hypothetical protein
LSDTVTDGIEQWIVDLPVWLQTPLVLAVLIPVAGVIAVLMTAAARRIAPLSEEEQRLFGADAAPSEKPSEKPGDVPGEKHSEEGESQ